MELKGIFQVGAKELILYYKQYLKEIFPIVLVSIIGFFIPSLVYASFFIWFFIAGILCVIIVAKIREKTMKYSVTFELNKEEYFVLAKNKEVHWKLSKLYRVVETEQCFFIYKGKLNFICLPKYQMQQDDIEKIKQIFETSLDEKRLRFLP